MPVWAVGGYHSMGMEPFEQFQRLAQSVKGGVIDDCGHWIMKEQPARLLEDLEQFLRE
jgi:pimeloyl-ACP methyl ester carboxylesterase